MFHFQDILIFVFVKSTNFNICDVIIDINYHRRYCTLEILEVTLMLVQLIANILVMLSVPLGFQKMHRLASFFGRILLGAYLGHLLMSNIKPFATIATKSSVSDVGGSPRSSFILYFK